MNSVHNTIAKLELAQIGWVVPDIHAAMKFLSNALRIAGFHPPAHVRAQDLNMTYYGKIVAGEWLTTQTYSGGAFIELIQPVSGNSIFQDFIDKNPSGGIQHIAYSIPVDKLNKIISEFSDKGFPVISTFDHPIAKIVFFNTCKEIGVMTEIMGITEEGEKAVQQMKGQTS